MFIKLLKGSIRNKETNSLHTPNENNILEVNEETAKRLVSKNFAEIINSAEDDSKIDDKEDTEQNIPALTDEEHKQLVSVFSELGMEEETGSILVENNIITPVLFIKTKSVILENLLGVTKKDISEAKKVIKDALKI